MALVDDTPLSAPVAAPAAVAPRDALHAFFDGACAAVGPRTPASAATELDEVFGQRLGDAAQPASRGADAIEAPDSPDAPDGPADPSSHAGETAPGPAAPGPAAPGPAAGGTAPTGAGSPPPEVLSGQRRTGDDAAVLSPSLRALVEAVAAVGAVPPADLPGALAVAEAALLLQQLEVLRAVVLSRVADVDSRKLHTLVDAPSTGTWLATQQTSLTRAEVALARRLTAFPRVTAAVDDGRVSVAVAARLVAALVKVRRHVDRPDGLIDGQPAEQTLEAVIVDGCLTVMCQARGGMADTDPLLACLHGQLLQIATTPGSELGRLEEAFVLLAGHVESAHLPGALGLLLDALLPNELERRAAEGHDLRGLRLRRKDDGSGWLITRGELDLECGELLQTVLAAELAVDPDNPVDTAGYAQARADGWQPGLDGSAADGAAGAGHGGPRSQDQRRHDALKNGLRRYLDSGVSGLRDKVAPHLSVTVTLGALDNRPGALPPVAASGSRLPRSLVQAWACDSSITRFVLSLGRRVLEVSHTERTLKAHERRAKRLETGGRCQEAGCPPRPGQRLIPHHADPWAGNGRTSMADTVMFCEQSHHHLHQGHTLRLTDGRRLGPHGWIDDDPPG